MRDDASVRRTKKATYGAPEHPSAAHKSRHARKCSVCHHPDLEFINEDYLRWRSPGTIARDYGIAHHSAVYRHAAAMGLRHERRATLRATLENFIEHAETVRVTADSVIRAVQTYAQINDDGQWNPTPRRHIVEYRRTPAPNPDAGTLHTSAGNVTPADLAVSILRTPAGLPASTAASSAAPHRESAERFPAGSSGFCPARQWARIAHLEVLIANPIN